MSSAAIRAGAAFVEVMLRDKLTPQLRGIQQKLAGFGAAVRGLGARMIGFGSAVGAPFLAAIKFASDAEEAASKFGFVFGAAASDTEKSLDAFAAAAGRSRFELRELAANVGAILRPLGMTEEAAGKTSAELVALASDLASFFNSTDEEALYSLQAALIGSSEPMRKFGVILTEEKVKAQALAMGLAATEGELTDLHKTQARLAIIMRDTTTAQGDAIRTAGSFANVYRRLTGALKDTATLIGQALLPDVTALAGRVGKIVQSIADWAKANQKLVAMIARVTVGVIAAGAVLFALGAAIGAAAYAFTILNVGIAASLFILKTLAAVVAAMLSPWGLALAAVVAIGAALLYFTGLAEKAFATIKAALGPLGERVSETFAGMKAAIEAGDIEAAARLLWASLKSIWTEGKASLIKPWLEIKYAVLDVFNEIEGRLAGFDKLAAMGLSGVIEKLTGIKLSTESLKTLFEQLWTAFNVGIAEALKYVDQLFARLGRLADAAGAAAGNAFDKYSPFAGPPAKQQVGAVLSDAGKLFKAISPAAMQANLAKLFGATGGNVFQAAGALSKDDRDKRAAELDKAKAAELEKIEAERAKAAKEYRIALDEALQARKRREEELAAKKAGASDDGAAKTAGGESTGTFSARAAALLGLAGAPADRIARATEKSAKKLEDIDKRLAADGTGVIA